MALFESYERRIDQINAVLNSYGISSIEEAEKITKDAGLDVYDQVKKIQPICFENACWAYTVGAAIAIKKGCRRAADAAAAIGEGLQAFCIPGSVADHRKVGLGHGNLGKMLLEEETECFCFLAGHESFAAAHDLLGPLAGVCAADWRLHPRAHRGGPVQSAGPGVVCAVCGRHCQCHGRGRRGQAGPV